MKQFFGAFFGSILGIVLATVLTLLIIVGAVKSSFGSIDTKDNDQTSKTKANSVLKLVLEGPIADREKENPFKELGDLSSIMGESGYGLNTMLQKIHKATTDDKIKGIYLYSKNLEAGFATSQELRAAL